MEKRFGDYIKTKRLSLGLTLRAFSAKHGFDPAYVSRLENSFMLPPENEEKLSEFARALELKEGSEEYLKLFDLAAASRNKLSEKLVSDNPNVVDFLPAFFRVARKDEIKKDDVETLLKLIRGDKVGEKQ